MRSLRFQKSIIKVLSFIAQIIFPCFAVVISLLGPVHTYPDIFESASFLSVGTLEYRINGGRENNRGVGNGSI